MIRSRKYRYALCVVMAAAVLGACAVKKHGGSTSSSVADKTVNRESETMASAETEKREEVQENAETGSGEAAPVINETVPSETDVPKPEDISKEKADAAPADNANEAVTVTPEEKAPEETPASAVEKAEEVTAEERTSSEITSTQVGVTSDMTYAGFSAINSGSAVLYKNSDAIRGKYVICVNAGHGTRGGESVKTQCHPDGSAKVTGGTTGSGAVKSSAISSGMTFNDGTAESKVTLAQALILKDLLLEKGYSVLMIREGDDVQLDNIARTVLANNYADVHISLHWDSTENNKGVFYCSVPNVASYRAMEPVASNWEKSHKLGDAVIGSMKSQGVKIFSGGSMAIDLTQTAYSSIPSIDLELGDKASDHSDAVLTSNATAIIGGLDSYFGIS